MTERSIFNQNTHFKHMLNAGPTHVYTSELICVTHGNRQRVSEVHLNIHESLQFKNASIHE